ncbi:MAG: thiamine pyrophosphate-dependent enzyme [Bacteroidota bacterium]
MTTTAQTRARGQAQDKSRSLPGAMAGLPKERVIGAYRNVLAARLIDARILVLLKQGKVFFHIGGSGHETAQVATALAMRPGYDWAYPYYRDLAFSLQFGYTVEEIMLEALHRAGGPSSNGFAMPFHYGHKKWRIIAQSSPTGTQYLGAVGTAMGAVKDGVDEVVYVSSGEGATSEGEFHEAVNWASRERLPVVFLIQNNRYAISVPVRDQVSGGSVTAMTKGYEGLHRFYVDGCDFPLMYETAAEAVALARRGEGPSIIEADTVRLLPHSSSDDQRKYRDPKDLEADEQRDPIPRLERRLQEAGILTAEECAKVRQEIQKRIDDAAEWAERQPLPDPSTLEAHVYGPAPAAPTAHAGPVPTGPPIVMVDAINHALAEELALNPRMLIYGEDVAGKKGGVFTATKGLTDKFGEARVFNSPLAEASIVGTAMGLAVRGGFKPVVEIQFGDYIWPAFMQIRDEVAMLRFRSCNEWSCPMVIRVAVGGYIHGGLYHSQSIDGFFAHIPGIRVVFPSNAADAKGLLKTACRCDDPVLFLEHKGLYRQGFASSPEPGPDVLVPFGVANVKKSGEDITVITWGMMVQRSLDAAKKVEKETGVTVEVIDLRTLNPLDRETIFGSVRKTGKALIVHEDTLTGGFGGEIVALIAAECFDRLDAPVRRVAAKDTPVPYGPGLENAMLPQEADVVDALRALAGY